MEKNLYSAYETERTLLRVLTLDYSKEVFELFSDPTITEYMDIEPCKDLKEAEDIIQFHLDDEGFRWGIFDKNDETFIGTCGFHYLRKTDQGIVAEIGYDLNKNYWGRGIMSEVAESLLEFGFKEMSLAAIDATVEPNNRKSIRLLERLGFTKMDVLMDGLTYYKISLSEFKNNSK